LNIEFVTDAEGAAESAVAVPVFSESALSEAARTLDEKCGGALARALKFGRFTGAVGDILEVVAPPGDAAGRVILVGVGDEGTQSAEQVELYAARAFAAADASGVAELVVNLPIQDSEAAAAALLGMNLAAYRFDRYRTKEKPSEKASVTDVRVIAADVSQPAESRKAAEAIAGGVAMARNLVNEPANVLGPEEFAARLKALECPGLTVEILGEAELTALGMGALLAVGKASAQESRVAVLRWNGAADPDAPPIAFVGKGVCFDSGGLSIKPAEGMENMKIDMGGAAAVAGLFYAMVTRGARVNAVGLLGLVENMIDADALRPGDVITSLSGQTIEVMNTDAEGRLVLADLLWYAQDRFAPAAIVDVATLTGSVAIALGEDYAGLFSNDELLAERLLKSGEAERELLWRMPLPKSYEKQIKSPIADMKNIGGRLGGSITAALFLKRFVRDIPWAHLDIAATAARRESTDPTVPPGASGFGVRLLNRLVADNYEH
jgi:leucyl aminopeptidase